MEELDLTGTDNRVPTFSSVSKNDFQDKRNRMAVLAEIDLLNKKNSIALRRRQSWYSGLECGYEEISEKLKSKAVYPMDEFYQWLKAHYEMKCRVLESRQASYKRTLSEDEYVSYRYSCGVLNAYRNVISVLGKGD